MSKGNVKRAILLFIPLLAVSAHADDLLLARRMMNSAMNELASHNRFTVIMIGKEVDDDVAIGTRIDLAYEYTITGGRAISQIELLNMRNNDLIDRIAGDGVRIWNYKVARNQYSSSDYGTADYFGKERLRLFQLLSKRSQGAQTFLSRLMIDTFSQGTSLKSQWMPWRPSSTVSINGAGNIVCDSHIPNPSQLTYVLAKDRLFGYRLVSVKYLELSQISGRERSIEWEATIYRDWIPKDTSYMFVPPKGSKPVTATVIRGGG